MAIISSDQLEDCVRYARMISLRDLHFNDYDWMVYVNGVTGEIAVNQGRYWDIVDGETGEILDKNIFGSDGWVDYSKTYSYELVDYCCKIAVMFDGDYRKEALEFFDKHHGEDSFTTLTIYTTDSLEMCPVPATDD